MVSLNRLIEKIEILRKKMINAAERSGLNNQEAINISKELDELLNCYENEKSNCPK